VSSPRNFYDIPLPSGGGLHLGARCLVMGILNVTPDSFADGRRFDSGSAIEAALRLADEGADIIDIGGESTRPGADPVPAEEEAARVLPVIRAIVRQAAVPVSVDTYKADVAGAALAEGASIVNDVSGLQYEPALATVVRDAGAALVLMHTRGRPKTMYAAADYGDPVGEVTAELAQAVARARAAGVPEGQTIVDPGIGFAKRPEHSYGVLAGIPEISAALDRPVLVGPSRKSFMRAALANRPPLERDWGTAAAVAAAVLGGAHIVRVHAVAEMLQVVRVAEEIRRYRR
jgi:dihydropteroate synthase